MSAGCGSDAGYYQHRIKGLPFPEDQGKPTCGCRKAHAEAESRRAANRPPRVRPHRPPEPRTKRCADCPTMITPTATRCQPCAFRRLQERRAAERERQWQEELTVRWVRRGMVWRKAA